MDDEEKSVTDKVQLDKIKNEEVDLQYNEEGHLEYVSVMDYATVSRLMFVQKLIFLLFLPGGTNSSYLFI